MPASRKSGPMKKWRPSPPELIETFGKTIASQPEAQVRKMFGYPCAFVGGNMFTGLHQENMIMRLSEKDRTAFLKLRGAAQFEPMPGRAMKEYVVVPEPMLAKPAELKIWLGKSFAYASSLPPKSPKPKKQPKK